MLMILPSTLSVIRHLIFGNNEVWHLIYETLWIGTESDLLFSVLEKLNLFRFNGLISLVLLI